jgi:FMN-dependent oxidoreductase (nitrilotriacetate monooxygenase family)
MSDARIRLNAFDMTCAGHLAPGLWRHPDDRSTTYNRLAYWQDLARLLERGRFDGLFIADVVGIYDVFQDGPAAAIRQAAQVPVGDPMMAVAAMAGVTEHLGFGITVSVTYEKPYALARRFGTLDQLTGGRVAWNVVTSYLRSAAINLGLYQQIPHDERYAIAEEFLEVCYKLWESSWDEDAVVIDRESGVYADPAKVHPIGHHGRYYDVPGIALTEPSPQRTPVIYQAGSSDSGRSFAARHAEGVFLNGPRPDVLRRTVDDIRARAAAAGRDPRSLKFFAMLTVITGATDEEAHRKHAEFKRYVSYEGAMALFSGWSGLDMAQFDPDVPLRHIRTEAAHSAIDAFARDTTRTWTPREVAEWVGLGGVGGLVVGGPRAVADELERWVDEGDIDGFNLAYVITPGTFEDFITHVVPELRRRGRVWDAYPGDTLRESFYGAGQRYARDDHPAARHRGALRGAPSALDPSGDGDGPQVYNEKSGIRSLT